MKKKLLAVLCAGALALALAVPAFAALQTEFTSTTTMTGAGTVSVTVPASTGKLYINTDGSPYQIGDNTAGDYTIKGGDAITKRVFSTPGLLVNTGDSNLTVKVSMTATPDGVVELGSTASDGDHIAVSGNLTIGTAAVSGTTVTPTWTGGQDIAIAATVPETAVTAPLPKASKDNLGASVPGALVYRLTGDLDFGADVSTWGTSDSLAVKVVFTLTPAS